MKVNEFIDECLTVYDESLGFQANVSEIEKRIQQNRFWVLMIYPALKTFPDKLRSRLDYEPEKACAIECIVYALLINTKLHHFRSDLYEILNDCIISCCRNELYKEDAKLDICIKSFTHKLNILKPDFDQLFNRIIKLSDSEYNLAYALARALAKYYFFSAVHTSKARILATYINSRIAKKIVLKDDFENVLKSQKDFELAYYTYALFLRDDDKNIEADKRIKDMIKNCGNNPKALTLYAIYLYRYKNNLTNVFKEPILPEIEAKLKDAVKINNDIADKQFTTVKRSTTHKNYPLAYYTYATILKENGRKRDACEIFEKALEKKANQNNELVHFYYAYFLAEYCLYGKNAKDAKACISEAKKHFIKAIKLDGNNPKIHFKYATFLYEICGKSYEAKEQFSLAVKQDPTLMMARFRYSSFLIDCVNKVKSKRKHKPIRVNCWYQTLIRKLHRILAHKLYIYLKSNFLIDCANKINLKIKHRSISVNCWYQRQIYKPYIYIDNYVDSLKCLHYFRDTKRTNDAVECFRRALTFDPDDLTYALYAALLKDITGMDKEAEWHFKHAISLNKKNLIARFYYALFLNDCGRNNEAETQWKEMWEIIHKQSEKTDQIAPEYSVLMAAYANFLSKSAIEEEELCNYHLLKNKSGKEIVPYINAQYQIYSANRKREASKREYENALKSDPNNVVIRYSYGLFLSQQYELHYDAMREVKKAMEMEPSNPYVLFAYGDIAANEKQYSESIKWYKKALKNPIALHFVTKSAIYNNLGWSYAKLADTSSFWKLWYYSQAKKFIRKAIIEDMYNIKALRNHQSFKNKWSLCAKTKTILYRAFPSILMVITITSAFLLYLGNIDFAIDIFGRWMLEGKLLLLSFFMSTLILFYMYINKIRGMNVAGIQVDFNLEKNNPLSNERIDSRPCEILQPRFLFLGYL
ncbi:hypothetical protein [Methanolobus bombayensis]|uniref:hypothetical protein n=1 Tax=Methanolobus bombayensis TaxID=38023 RepID=UPI001AE3263A|nr:hypothetical protein [Methanolobus bombayensis]MBP1910431.1 tetratricopeptide (TPR) repeat protein [Methanolobus bombayensis]